MYNKKALWGRQVLSNNDIFWEYKGASSIVLHNNIQKLEKWTYKPLNESERIARIIKEKLIQDLK